MSGLLNFKCRTVQHTDTNKDLIHSGAERTHFFQIIVTFFFNIKIMLTPNQPAVNAILIPYIDYSITENYMASFLPYKRPEPLLKVLHHIY